jgi:iron complex outermembrane recepter protein
MGVAAMASNIAGAQAVTNAPADNETGASGESAGALQEIIVTAQKRAERLNDVPMSVSASTGEQLQQLGITSPAALENVVPGFVFTQSAYAAGGRVHRRVCRN